MVSFGNHPRVVGGEMDELEEYGVPKSYGRIGFQGT